jgi:endonuclease YncB( thermonuclease family)
MFESWRLKNKTNKLQNVDIDSVKPFSFDGSLFLAKVVHVVDGDSCTIVIKYNKEWVSLKCRLYGIDTPETRTKNPEEKLVAYHVKEYVADKILDKIIWAECFHYDSFGRTLVKIYTENPEYGCESLNQELVAMNYAYEYAGKKKQSFDDWCKIQLNDNLSE